MTQAEMKRRVGYVQPDYQETCGTCRNCKRRGCHLRCAKWDFAVVADGICRNGYEKPDAPLNTTEHPVLTFKQDLIEHLDGLVSDGIRIVPATAEDISGVVVEPMLLGYDPAAAVAAFDAAHSGEVVA